MVMEDSEPRFFGGGGGWDTELSQPDMVPQ